MPIPSNTAGIRAESLLESEETPAAALEVRPQHPFLYVFYPHDPGNWRIGHVDGEAVWLPVLQKRHLVPGAGGVRTLRKGESPELAYSGAVEKIRLRGGVVLDRALDYCYRTPARDPITGAPGFVYHDQFETPRVPKGRKKRIVKYDADVEARDAWLAHLITSGRLPPPHPDIVDHNLGRLLDRVYERADRRQVQLPSDLSDIPRENLPKLVDEALAAHDQAKGAKVLEGRKEEAFVAPADKPKPRRRRKPKAEPATADAGLAVEASDDG